MPWRPRSCIQRHGIHVSERADGAWQVLAVQHGGRESVEIFEVVDGPALSWRGCAIPPEKSLLNDVVATPDDGFLTTHMMSERRGMGQMVAFLKAKWFDSSGHVLSWTPDAAVALADTSVRRKCMHLEEGSCPGEHAILSVDPTTFDSAVLYEGGPGTPGGAGTTGLLLDDETLLIGTFAGDRLVRVSL